MIKSKIPVIGLVILLTSCTIGDNLDERYTKETVVQIKKQGADVCFSLPIQENEIIVSAITYNLNKSPDQIVFPANKQAVSGLFCISPVEYKFTAGQEYITHIEVNKRENDGDKKSTRKAFVATFLIEKKGAEFDITQTVHK